MYKIYLNDKEIVIDSWLNTIHTFSGRLSDKVLPFFADRKYLIKWTLKNEKLYPRIVFMASDPDQAFHYFQNVFKVISAAGGVVVNESQEVLAIFRKDHWDLPKGKIDKGEEAEQTAVREVEEETGVTATLQKYLGTTYHIYPLKKKWIFKISIWYIMQAAKCPLVFQTEEDITGGAWVSPEKLLDYRPIYPNIKNILITFLESKNQNA